uniref:MFS domain-containing protein n=1 Tax=Wuchereria bancrofti TaxID=6293 RepID=A0A1I8EYY7_WUCBA
NTDCNKKTTSRIRGVIDRTKRGLETTGIAECVVQSLSGRKNNTVIRNDAAVGHIWIVVQWSFDPSFCSLGSVSFTMLDREEEVETKERIVEAALSDLVPVHSEDYQLYNNHVHVARLEKKATHFPLCDKFGTESTCSSSVEEPIPPDGGYGWIIVLASFLIHFICDGISFSFGIMFSEIQGHFNVTKTMSGIVGSIFLSIPLLSGPLAGALTDIYDCRRMTIVGGLIAAGGGLISFFAFSVWHFLLSFAFITGIGLSFCFNSAIVAVTYYFQKKRAIATGIAVCGSGAGTFVLAPFIEMLFAKFGWRSSLLCMGFLLLFIVGCGFMIKMGFPYTGPTSRRTISLPSIPTYATPLLQVIDQSLNVQSVKVAANELQIPVSKSYSMGEFLRAPENDMRKEHALTFDGVYNVGIDILSGSPRQVCSKENYHSGIDDLVSSQMSKVENKFSNRTLRGNDGLDEVVSSRQSGVIYAGFVKECMESYNLVQEDAIKEPLLDDDTKGGKSETQTVETCIRNVRNSCIATQLGAAQGRVPAANVLSFRWKFVPFGVGMSRRIPSAPAICYRRKRKRRTIRLSKMWGSFLEWISNTKLVLVVPEFSIFLLSTFILYVFFDIPYVNFPEYAVEIHNVTETKASYLVSSIGLTNMVSMLFCGIIADWSRTSQYIIQMYGIFITLAGLCVALTPFATSYIHLLTLCIGFGFFISANYTLASVITLQILCLYDFQTGYGILCLVEGLGNLIGPALIGFIRDNLTGYDNIFLLAGAGIMISGLMVVAINIFMLTCDTDHEKKRLMKHDRYIGTGRTALRR